MRDKNRQIVAAGDILLDGGGIYEVEEVRETQVLVHEVEIDEDGHFERVSDTWYWTKIDLARTEKIWQV